MDNKILNISSNGILDEMAMMGLLAELENALDSGFRTIIVDAEKYETILAEAILLLKEKISQIGLEQAGATLIWENLSTPVSTQFQIFGFRVNGHRCMIPEPESHNKKTSLLACEKCSAELEVDEPGLYRCPECSTHFHVDIHGHIKFYDSLKAIKEPEI